ncbi:MAG: hypothetical protein K0R17_2383 [Rariglobus sp.]|jgi:hypothetical protein|nr:hypothetical protein [Rariglobus sp.]
MNHPEEAPKLPKLPFITADLVLIAAAVVIATRSAAPIGPGPLLAITICVVFGAALLVIPFLANYARRQDAELTDRQNQIAALARTTADSAEQLSIAAAGLHGIAESSRQNLDTIGKLPAQLQKRIDDLTQQLAGSAIASQTSLKEDLVQLEAAAEKISRALAKLDSTAKTKSDALASIEKDLASALARATTQIDAFVTNAITHAVRTTEVPAATAPATAITEAPASDSKPKAPKSKGRAGPLGPPPQSPDTHAPNDTPDTPTPAPESPANISVAAIADEPAPAPAAEEPAPATIATPAEAEVPVAATKEPEPAFTAAEPDSADVPVSEPEAPKPPRARKTKSAEDAGFDLGLTPDASDAPETAVTSDGFTRLIATAYIGIGNKLYIRGSGPGLSWEKGVPLQFVSIGKWRWETPDASAPITAKLYKNDQVECQGLGQLTLEPGHQHEVNAGF